LNCFDLSITVKESDWLFQSCTQTDKHTRLSVNTPVWLHILREDMAKAQKYYHIATNEQPLTVNKNSTL